MKRTLLLLIVAVALLSRVGQSQSIPPEPVDATASAKVDATAATTQIKAPKRLRAKHLPNPVQVHPKVISGGLPEGEAAFRELQQLGVETIISVDGAKPDVATAEKFGLRYVHLPHGYDGVPIQRVQELAKAVRDLDGPIYIHCHHGKHRSPAAASVACVAAGLIPQSDGLKVLALAGTSPNYRGLFDSARTTVPLKTALLDELNVEFRETLEVPPLAEAMVAIEHAHDRLKAIAKANWSAPADHPDLAPAHEALLLREHFTELLRVDYIQSEPEEFKHLLKDSEQAALELETTIRKWQRTKPSPQPPKSLNGFANRINANCKACHQKFRDIPLGEK